MLVWKAVYSKPWFQRGGRVVDGCNPCMARSEDASLEGIVGLHSGARNEEKVGKQLASGRPFFIIGPDTRQTTLLRFWLHQHVHYRFSLNVDTLAVDLLAFDII